MEYKFIVNLDKAKINKEYDNEEYLDSTCTKCGKLAQGEYTGIDSKDSLFSEFGDYISLCNFHAEELKEIFKQWLKTT